MKRVTYKKRQASGVGEKVYLDEKHVGSIRPVAGGWRYFPKGSENGGEVFKNIQDCKDSLEQE